MNRHLLTMDALSATEILHLISIANQYNMRLLNGAKVEPCLQQRFLVSLFFENSTRTRNSFQIAAQRLGCHVVSVDSNASSLKKGETLVDTLLTYEAMGIDFIVLRHPTSNIFDTLSPTLLKRAHLINAGDGMHEHPTQTLTDLFTLHQYQPEFTNLKIAIVGDIKHSRVANSLIRGLIKMNVQSIHLVAPDCLQIATEHYSQNDKLKKFHLLEQGLESVDFIFVLRLQKERMDTEIANQLIDYPNKYQITASRLARLPAHVKVMHAGPINRGIEIEDSVADGKQSLILEQVRNSISIRMAVLGELIKI